MTVVHGSDYQFIISIVLIEYSYQKYEPRDGKSYKETCTPRRDSYWPAQGAIWTAKDLKFLNADIED